MEKTGKKDSRIKFGVIARIRLRTPLCAPFALTVFQDVFDISKIEFIERRSLSRRLFYHVRGCFSTHSAYAFSVSFTGAADAIFECMPSPREFDSVHHVFLYRHHVLLVHDLVTQWS